jgi:hypothetical protein
MSINYCGLEIRNEADSYKGGPLRHSGAVDHLLHGKLPRNPTQLLEHLTPMRTCSSLILCMVVALPYETLLSIRQISGIKLEAQNTPINIHDGISYPAA